MLPAGGKKVVLAGDLHGTFLYGRFEVVAHLCDDDKSVSVLGKAAFGVEVLVLKGKLSIGALLVVTNHFGEHVARLVFFVVLALFCFDHEDVNSVLVRGAREVLGDIQIVEAQRVDVGVGAATSHLLESLHRLGLSCLLCVEEPDDCTSLRCRRKVVARLR